MAELGANVQIVTAFEYADSDSIYITMQTTAPNIQLPKNYISYNFESSILARFGMMTWNPDFELL